VLNAVRLTVAPLRYGAGIKGKVLESFASGVPCVMTPIAAEGLPLPEDALPLVARNADQFAELCLRLHSQERANGETAVSGRRMIDSGFVITHPLARCRNV
jgi:hypothetical protein